MRGATARWKNRGNSWGMMRWHRRSARSIKEISSHVSVHHGHVQGAPTCHTPGTSFLTADSWVVLTSVADDGSKRLEAV